MTLTLDPEAIDLATLRQLWQGAPAKLDAASLDRIRASAASVERIVAGGETVYGVNTGFGLLASTRIPAERLAELQRNLILSHSCGLGDALPRHVVRLMIVLKLLGLGRGYSGVRPLVIDALQGLLDRDAMPLIPAQGSVGARGDLAPLAHLIAALMGEARIDLEGEILPARDALDKLGMAAARARPQGRPRPHQRHPGLDRDRPRRLVHGRAGVRRRARRRRAVGRCARRAAIKPFDPRISARFAASPARSASPPKSATCSTAAQIVDQPLPLRPGAGPLQLPLPAAGDGRQRSTCSPTPRAP